MNWKHADLTTFMNEKVMLQCCILLKEGSFLSFFTVFQLYSLGHLHKHCFCFCCYVSVFISAFFFICFVQRMRCCFCFGSCVIFYFSMYLSVCMGVCLCIYVLLLRFFSVNVISMLLYSLCLTLFKWFHVTFN